MIPILIVTGLFLLCALVVAVLLFVAPVLEDDSEDEYRRERLRDPERWRAHETERRDGSEQRARRR